MEYDAYVIGSRLKFIMLHVLLSRKESLHAMLGARRSGSASKGKGNSMFRYGSEGTDQSGGVQVTPTTVVVSSLAFICVIIVLHFYGKFMR